MTTKDLITMYRSERSEAKLGQQLFAIPKIVDMVDRQTMFYYTGDRRRTPVDFQREICFHLKYLDIKPISTQQYIRFQESTTPMEWLIQSEIIYPFLLFVNGYLIRWENIIIIASQGEYDLLIRGLDYDFFKKINPTGVIDTSEVCTVRLPDSIVYLQGGYPIDAHTLFAFDENGVFMHRRSGIGYIVINNYDTNVELFDFNPVTEPTFLFADDPMYKYFPENVFVFKGEKFDHNAPVSILATAMMVYNNTLPEDDPNGIHVRVFHNTKFTTPSYDNLRKVDIENIKQDLFAALQGDTVAEYLNKLQPSFDPPIDSDINNEENINASLDYYAQYDSMLFNRVYRSNKDFIELEVDYNWIIHHLDEDGNLKIPRRFQDGVNFFIMVMVNGELYQYYRMHKYQAEYFYCPIQNMQDGDKIELLYFKKCNNFSFHANIDENEPYLKLDKDIYNIDNLRIFSKFTTDTYFTFPDSAQTAFPVQYTLEEDTNDSRAIRIRYNDNNYYGKDVVLASAHRFQYFIFDYDDTVITTNDDTSPLYYSVDLSDKFLYCNEYNRYLIFFNGKRLINDMYRIVLPYRSTTPFTKAMVYLCVPVGPGDRLEVFYLPHHFIDIYNGTDNTIMDENGTIIIDKSKIDFSLDNQLYSIWINAKKIPASSITNISSTKLQINTDITSTTDVRITTMISSDEIYNEFKTRFKAVDSNWDQAVDLYKDHFTLMGLTKPTITDTDPVSFDEVIPTIAIMNEIIRDWYQCNETVDITGAFLYDYTDVDQSAIVGQDPGGNTILGTADSNEANNLDVNRPWP